MAARLLPVWLLAAGAFAAQDSCGVGHAAACEEEEGEEDTALLQVGSARSTEVSNDPGSPIDDIWCNGCPGPWFGLRVKAGSSYRKNFQMGTIVECTQPVLIARCTQRADDGMCIARRFTNDTSCNVRGDGHGQTWREGTQTLNFN